MAIPRAGARELAVGALASLVVAGCAPTLGGRPWPLPWEEQPEHFQWMISFGPAVGFWNDAPRDVTDLFFSLRLGVYMTTAGEYHISEERAAESFIDFIGRHTFFRSGIPFVPDNVFISPLGDLGGMSVYGVSFRPTSIGMHPAGGLFRFGFSGGWVVTYAHIEAHREGRPVAGLDGVEFFQPGLDARADLELDWGSDLFLSVGWNSLFHLPQTLEPGGRELWHIGQGFFLFNVRLPATKGG